MAARIAPPSLPSARARAVPKRKAADDASDGACAPLPVAQRALREMGEALSALSGRIDATFETVADMLRATRGCVHVAGIGKSFLVAQKTAATLTSVGTPAVALHATEAVHGDIGRMQPQDVALLLSHSGETQEMVRLAHLARGRGVTCVAITGDEQNALSRAADATLTYGPIKECAPLRLVPSVSAIAMMALGDALALCCLAARSAPKRTYAERHPAGALGRHLQTVNERMRFAAALPVAADTATLDAVVRIMTETEGSPGAACLVDAEGRLTGLFTDGDLRRLVCAGPIDPQSAISRHMRRAPYAVDGRLSVAEAADLLLSHHIDQLPVLDAEGRPVGLLDIQDVVSAWGG